jgi:hypothetical protein
MTISKKVLVIEGLFLTFSINETQYNNSLTSCGEKKKSAKFKTYKDNSSIKERQIT